MKAHSFLLLLAALSTPAAAQTNITPASSLAYSGNTGWLDPKAGSGSNGVIAGQCVCAGFLYSANCGWINMGDGTPNNGAQYTNTNGVDAGVNRLPDGKLRGLAWGANIGWINFENTGNPRIDPATHQLLGHAWSASTGWISLATPAGGIFILDSDVDNDGLPDAWENSYATTATLGAGDLDGDGASDADEYAAGTDPTESGSQLLITAFTPTTGTAASITWTSSPARNYRVQVSSDLLTWNYASFQVIPPANPLISAGAAGTTTTRSVIKPAGPRAFFRVIALKPPAQP